MAALVRRALAEVCTEIFNDFAVFSYSCDIHRESKKGATLTIAITLSILDPFAKYFHCYKEQ